MENPESDFKKGRPSNAKLLRFVISVIVAMFGISLGGWSLLTMLSRLTLTPMLVLITGILLLVVAYVIQPFKEPTN